MSAQPSVETRIQAHWPTDPGEASTVTPGEVVRFVRSGGWLVAAVMAACLGAGLLFDLASTPRYVATSQIIIDPRGLQLVDKQVSQRAETADADVATVEDEMRVLKSTNLLSELIDKENLLANPEFVPQRSSIVDRVLDLLPRHAETPDGARLAVLQKLDQQIAVRRAERGYVVDLAVTSADPAGSARLANRLVAIYIERANQIRSDLAHRSSVGLGNRLDELQDRVRKADEKVEAFRTANNLVSAGGVLTSDQRLKDLNTQLVVARTRADEAKARLDQIRRLQTGNGVEAVPEALQSQAVAHLRDQLTGVRRRLSTLKDQLGPRHPDYVSAASELRALEGLLSQELRRLAESSRIEYARAKDGEEAVQRSVDALSQASLTDSRSLVMLRELERDADASRALFTAFLARSQELSEQTRLDTTNVRQISAAMPPLRRANPSHGVVLFVSLTLGLLLGTALAVGLGIVDRMRDGPHPAVAAGMTLALGGSALSAPRGAAPRGLARLPWRVLFAMLALMMSVNAFYSLFQGAPASFSTQKATVPSNRDNLLYVGLWVALYGASAWLFLRSLLRKGIDYRVFAIAPFAVYIVCSAVWSDTAASIVPASMLALDIVIAAALAETLNPTQLLIVMARLNIALVTLSLVLLAIDPARVMSDPTRPGLLAAGELFGVYGNKANLGGGAGIGIIILLFLPEAVETPWKRGLSVIVLALGVILSNSASSQTGCLAAAMVLLGARLMPGLRTALFTVISVLAALWSFSLPFISLGEATQLVGRSPDLTGRGTFWPMAPGFILERPFLGHGYAGFFNAGPYSRAWEVWRYELYFFTPEFHNTLLDVLIAFGLIGGFAYVTVLAVSLAVFSHRTLERRSAEILAAILIVYTLAAASEFVFLKHNSLPTLMLFYAYFVGGRRYGGPGAARVCREDKAGTA